MRLAQLREPLQAAVAAVGPRRTTPGVAFASSCLPQLLGRLRLDGGGSVVEGRRYASVKSQGAYRLKWKRTIPKKLGAKRTGDQYVIPGNIIYKQRGTIWHAGENALAGRDHTIHAAVTGYVKYYRDPARHPTRQYIGVAFNRNDTLPYPQNAVRRRKLGLVAQQRKPEPKESATVSPSGIPLWVTRRGDAFAGPESQGEGGSGAPKNKKAWVRAQRQKFERARKEKRDTQTLHLRSDYSYREHNWEIGRLVSDIGKVPGTGKIGSRKSIFRARRRRRNAEFVRLKGLNKARRERRIAHEKVVAEKRAVRAAEAAQEAEKARKRKLQENEESKENNKA